MATREIVTLPDPVLRQKARKVPAVTEDIRTLIDDMVETMRATPGVGLAAPQVGDSRRVIVVEYAEPPEEEGQPARPPHAGRWPRLAAAGTPARSARWLTCRCSPIALVAAMPSVTSCA